jgi:hypothetical protein
MRMEHFYFGMQGEEVKVRVPFRMAHITKLTTSENVLE